VDGAPAQTVNSTRGTKQYKKELMDSVVGITTDALCSYWITKFGRDWVRDMEVHQNLFDSLVCMRLAHEDLLETTEIMLPEMDSHPYKNGYPHYVTTYRIRSEKIADC